MAADLDDLAADLVAGANRRRRKPSGEVVQIAAADSTAAHADEDIVVTDRRRFDVAQFE